MRSSDSVRARKDLAPFTGPFNGRVLRDVQFTAVARIASQRADSG